MNYSKILLRVFLAFGIIILIESIPFLYDNNYKIIDMKWGWIIGVPIVLIIKYYYDRVKLGNNNKESKC